MKKIFTFAAVAAVVLSSCAKVDNYKVSAPEAISFGVYAGNAANTKAVSGTDFGTITNTELQASSNGFGVFAYYTDAADYASATKPNFMYNQQVTYSSDHWTYNPVKYWPNEHGSSAVSTDVDKLTFLAYAPFVANLDINSDHGVAVADTAATPAAATEGIIAMTANNVPGDAVLTFKVPASAEEQIDLLYGVMGAAYKDVQDTTRGAENGPLENLTKQKVGDKIQIKFKHSLAKIAINIKDVINKVEAESSVNPASTKVVVESVKLVGSSIGTQGKLNLYTGAWGDVTPATEFTVAPLPAAIRVDAAPTVYADIPAGVDENGLDKTIDLMLIPVAASTITGVEIVYYVCTEDAQLDGGVSVVKNTISKTLDTNPTTDGNQPLSIAMGKQYNLNVLLGLTSVDLTATVDNWTVESTTNVDLPKNVE